MRQSQSQPAVVPAYHYPLDVMRFAAAASVVAFHLTFYSWASNPRASETAHALHGAASFVSATRWTWFGWIGVEVFFVISGFVIANSAAGVSAGTFLKSRALRLLPAAWICATITLLVRNFAGLDPVRSLIAPYLDSLTLLPSGPWIDGVYWSLAVEIVFYALVFGLLCLHGFRWLPAFAFAITAASGLFLLLTASRLCQTVPGWWRLAPVAQPLLLRHGAFFAVGIWLWLFSERRLKASGAFGLGLALLVGCLEIWMRATSLQAGEAPAAAGQPVVVPIFIWVGLVAALLIVTRTPGRFTPRSRRVRIILRSMGLATYPLYLMHDVVGASMIRTFVLGGLPSAPALALTVSLIGGASFFVALFLEPRLRRLLRAATERIEALSRGLRKAPGSAPTRRTPGTSRQ